MPIGKNGAGLQGGGETGDIRRGPVVHSTTAGWRPTCEHTADPIPATVLDPFAGSGTTLMVARALGRNAIGLDLSLSYLREQARQRLGLDALAAWESGGKAAEAGWQDTPLFGVLE